jgi:3-oxoacyl-[acyl-carrier-protein] synthase III
MESMRGSAITGWGMALPPRIVTNDDLATIMDTNDAWITERTGIRSRRVASGPFVPPDPDAPATLPGGIGTTATLAIEAGGKAISAAGLAPSDIDLLILCTTSPDQAVPATSSAVSAALGTRGGAFDLNTACSGFVYGMVAASGFIGGGVDRVLVIGAETLSRITDWTDRSTAVLFADGAGAAVIEAVPGDSALLGWDLGVDGTLQSILYADHGGGIKMEGKEVFRRAVRIIVESAKVAMDRAKVVPDDITLFVPHQANARIIDAACSRLGIPMERTALNLDHTGNTSSASIPMALVESAEAGRLSDGDLVLLSGFGAGMTFASAVWRWGR